jgi:hypothetical protein
MSVNSSILAVCQNSDSVYIIVLSTENMVLCTGQLVQSLKFDSLFFILFQATVGDSYLDFLHFYPARSSNNSASEQSAEEACSTCVVL